MVCDRLREKGIRFRKVAVVFRRRQRGEGKQRLQGRERVQGHERVERHERNQGEQERRKAEVRLFVQEAEEGLSDRSLAASARPFARAPAPACQSPAFDGEAVRLPTLPPESAD